MGTRSSSDNRFGRVSDVPFARVFGDIAARGLTGALRLEQAGRRYAVYFDKGAVADAESSSPEDTLGRIALEAGLVDQAAVTETIKRMAQSPGKSQKDLFVELGALGGEPLAKALRKTLARRTFRIFSLPDATFTFEAGQHGRVEGGPIESRWALYRGLRAHYDEKRLEQEMGEHAGKAMKLLVPPEALGGFGFPPDELSVVGYLARAAAKGLSWELGDLVEACAPAPRLIVLSVVHALRAFNVLELQPSASVQRCRKTPRDGAQGLEVKGPPTQPPSPLPATGSGPTAVVEAAPRPTAPSRTRPATNPPRARAEAANAPAAKWTAAGKITGEQIEAKWKELERDADDFAILEIDRGAPAEVARAAFIRLIKLYHPDKLPEELRSHKPKVDRIVSRLTLANGNLTDETKRAAYLAELAQGGAAAKKRDDVKATEIVQKAFSAEDQYKRGCWEFRRQSYDKARECFQAAVDLKSDEPDYWALLAISKWRNAADKGAIKTEVMGDFSKAFKVNPDCLEAHLHRGMVYEELGETERAISSFSKVLSLNADHVEATRHLRVLEMRRGKDKDGGFFGLFGKKKDKPEDPSKKR